MSPKPSHRAYQKVGLLLVESLVACAEGGGADQEPEVSFNTEGVTKADDPEAVSPSVTQARFTVRVQKPVTAEPVQVIYGFDDASLMALPVGTCQ